MASAKPTKAPSGADFSVLVKKVNELASKVPGVAPLSATVTGRIPLWKRWVGSEGPEYAATTDGGLRAVLDANAKYLDEVKNQVDALDEREATHHAAQAVRLGAAEARLDDIPFP